MSEITQMKKVGIQKLDSLYRVLLIYDILITDIARSTAYNNLKQTQAFSDGCLRGRGLTNKKLCSRFLTLTIERSADKS